MDLETLKQLLKDGIITEEQFQQLSGVEEEKEESTEEPKKEPESPINIDEIVQKAIEKVTIKFGKDNKKLKEELEKERKKNLSAEELKELELKEREQVIKEKEHRLYAIGALKRAKLDTGEEDSLELIDFILAEDEIGIDKKVAALQKFAQKIQKNTTEEIYKTNGRIPPKGKNILTEENPYRKESFNFTKQMELEQSNPEEARRLQLAAMG